ncbi:hypothetical protein ACINK0_08840 [Deinococcus sp. VB343]|uniref:Outer membrane protein beta-barrel domain-containing protein n=1 Tax=Deinococcus sp. VB142 TaxID=3112952 RepID=A0AAU6Q5E0_9DEIO|nr:hypothetical protein [Deinococcus sp.]MDO4246196.1 hypothetical protein [Deinococcus sp.]
MKKFLAVVTTTLLASASAQTVVVQPSSSLGLNGLEFGVLGGYAGGLNGEVFVHAPNVAGPVGVKASAAYTSASDAIRDNVDITGNNSGLNLGTFGSYKEKGLATESGSHTTYALDATYNLGRVSAGTDLTLYAGGRYGNFSATETYANEAALTQTTRTSAFGVGAGAMLGYRLSDRASLVGDLGIDQYFNGTITNGTDNGTYNPNEAGYNDIRARFAFPGTVFKAKVGMKFNF